MMMLTPTTLGLAILATWLHLIISCLASPAGVPPSSTVPVDPNTAVSAHGIETVIAYPINRDGLDKLDREIRAIIIKGKVETLVSEHSIELKGIVCWFIEAEAEEIEKLKSSVAGVSIRIILSIFPRSPTGDQRPDSSFNQQIHVEPDEDIIEPAQFGDGGLDSFNTPPNGSLPGIELIKAVVRQTTAPPDLRVVSWPPGEGFVNLNSYAYEANSARDTYIYVIDRGLDPSNSVCLLCFNKTSVFELILNYLLGV